MKNIGLEMTPREIEVEARRLKADKIRMKKHTLKGK